MKRYKILIAAVLLSGFFRADLYGVGEERYIGFNFFKRGAESVKITGNFGKNKKIVSLPMLNISSKQWTLSLKLSPNFYYYRYIIDDNKQRTDPFIDDQVEISSGVLKGECSLLKVFPEEFNDYINMGDEFFREGKFREDKEEWAVDVFFKAVKEYSKEREGYVKLAGTYEALERYGFAADAYLAYLENSSKDYGIRRKLALVYEKLYRVTEKKDFRKNATDQWIKLIEAGRYVEEAKEYLNR
ncbi:MAG: hypothetical protein PF545_00445 [Elusimicrobia bacterium]|nr:hypothetical protein [Elusimicrobiota bacterium]